MKKGVVTYFRAWNTLLLETFSSSLLLTVEDIIYGVMIGRWTPGHDPPNPTGAENVSGGTRPSLVHLMVTVVTTTALTVTDSECDCFALQTTSCSNERWWSMARPDQLHMRTIAAHTTGVYGPHTLDMATHSVRQQQPSAFHQGMCVLL